MAEYAADVERKEAADVLSALRRLNSSMIEDDKARGVQTNVRIVDENGNEVGLGEGWPDLAADYKNARSK